MSNSSVLCLPSNHPLAQHLQDSDEEDESNGGVRIYAQSSPSVRIKEDATSRSATHSLWHQSIMSVLYHMSPLFSHRWALLQSRKFAYRQQCGIGHLSNDASMTNNYDAWLRSTRSFWESAFPRLFLACCVLCFFGCFALASHWLLLLILVPFVMFCAHVGVMDLLDRRHMQFHAVADLIRNRNAVILDVARLFTLVDRLISELADLHIAQCKDATLRLSYSQLLDKYTAIQSQAIGFFQGCPASCTNAEASVIAVLKLMLESMEEEFLYRDSNPAFQLQFESFLVRLCTVGVHGESGPFLSTVADQLTDIRHQLMELLFAWNASRKQQAALRAETIASCRKEMDWQSIACDASQRLLTLLLHEREEDVDVVECEDVVRTLGRVLHAWRTEKEHGSVGVMLFPDPSASSDSKDDLRPQQSIPGARLHEEEAADRARMDRYPVDPKDLLACEIEVYGNPADPDASSSESEPKQAAQESGFRLPALPANFRRRIKQADVATVVEDCSSVSFVPVAPATDKAKRGEERDSLFAELSFSLNRRSEKLSHRARKLHQC